MTESYCGAERRTSDPILAAWNERMSVLHADIAEMKSAIKEVAQALTKLALVEERQTHQSAALERAFKAFEMLGEKFEKMDARVFELEKREQNQQRTSDWVDRAVWAIVAATAAAVASKLGMIG
ncbi:MAG: hypothetical protein RLZZ555_538 [Pseudomonadota bacterium]|jgi:septal ring factor EnvC (AmiA/AmiB activator)